MQKKNTDKNLSNKNLELVQSSMLDGFLRVIGAEYVRWGSFH